MDNLFQEVVLAFQLSSGLFYSWILFVGLCVGSFLNVVIYRLPVMLENEWRSDCRQFLELDTENDKQQQTFNLAVPASSCPHCGHKIRLWENIPVISYLLLKGRCSNCKTHISVQYPIIEAITGLLSVAVAMHYGVSWQTTMGLFLTWVLVALTVIDIKKQLLPDNLTLPLLWLGLIVNSNSLYTDLNSALFGAIVGYLSLWSIYKLFKLLTGKEGMGYGDFKLLAALGAWMGWQMLPQIILLSSLVGAIIGIMMVIFTGRDRRIPIPFGPYLAIAGWIAFMWGSEINRIWLNI